MELEQVLYQVSYYRIKGDMNFKISHICFDSRLVRKDSLFVAIKGNIVDGHNFIGKSIENGAKVIIYQEDININSYEDITFLKVENSLETLAQISNNFYKNPSKKLKLIGITGTNGKTTTATLLYNFFRKNNVKSGLISTIKIMIDDKEIDTQHTTPDSITINKILHEMVKKGCKYCFMEVSSHAIIQQRISFLHFDGGVFTNITHDHLDYHKTFKNYIEAKKIFFDNLHQSAFALVNTDDKHSDYMLQNCKARKYSFGIRQMADFKAKVLSSGFEGMQLVFNETEFFAHQIGNFNVYNLLAAFGVLRLQNIDKENILVFFSIFEGVKGRFEKIRLSNGAFGIIDYAHTPDALENVLKTINQINMGTKKLICVFGAGGDRDKSKRPKMGKIATNYSDIVIITSDNPRFEDPDSIITDIEKGVDKDKKNNLLIIKDRKQAIKTAVKLSENGDIILVAGKGHENYQIIKGEKTFFDDKIILESTKTK